MAWFKVDDKFHSHRKRKKADLEAVGLWTVCGSWASDQLTDGFIPDYIAEDFGGRNWRRSVDRLVASGLWVSGSQGGDEGWWFHQFLERNPSREQVEADRAKTAARVANFRAKKAEERKGRGDV